MISSCFVFPSLKHYAVRKKLSAFSSGQGWRISHPQKLDGLILAAKQAAVKIRKNSKIMHFKDTAGPDLQKEEE